MTYKLKCILMSLIATLVLSACSGGASAPGVAEARAAHGDFFISGDSSSDDDSSDDKSSDDDSSDDKSSNDYVCGDDDSSDDKSSDDDSSDDKSSDDDSSDDKSSDDDSSDDKSSDDDSSDDKSSDDDSSDDKSSDDDSSDDKSSDDDSSDDKSSDDDSSDDKSSDDDSSDDKSSDDDSSDDSSSDDDCEEPPVNLCDEMGAPQGITLSFTGRSCADSSTTQGFAFTCFDYAPIPEFARIEVAGSNGVTLFNLAVAQGDEVELDAGAGNLMPDVTMVSVFDPTSGELLQQLEFNSSCLLPVLSNDNYGSLGVSAFFFDDGTGGGFPPL